DGGKIQWLKSGKSLDDPWTMYRIGEEPTVHRMCFADLDGKGMSLIVAPLMGRNSTAKNNWMDGSPVRILAYKIPKDPTKDRWVPEVLDESLHVVHNFWPIHFDIDGNASLLLASYEGVSLLRNGKRLIESQGNQANPKGNRGASEIKSGQLGNGRSFFATIEPWHGNQVVVYPRAMGERKVIDEDLKWGHAVWCADLD